jgi:hypothetical protein
MILSPFLINAAAQALCMELLKLVQKYFQLKLMVELKPS